MTVDALKLTTYFGEQDRVGSGLLADAIVDLFERRELRVSVLLRAMEGFGIKQRLRTDRLLTMSDDLPLVAVGVDEPPRIEALLPALTALVGDGLVTLERATLADGSVTHAVAADDQVKATFFLGRYDTIDGEPAYRRIVERLHEAGVAGASVLLGVDGTVHGSRERARLFGGNARVPLMIVSVGEHDRLDAVATQVRHALPDAIVTGERVQACKRDGRLIAPPREATRRDPDGLTVWRKLTVYCGEQSRHGRRPLYFELLTRLRGAGASGATALRGVWGYHGDHAPHGDRLFALRRHVPVVVEIVDTPENAERWFEIVDAVTDQTGLVTSELVPAFRAAHPDGHEGGLRLADTGR